MGIRFTSSSRSWRAPLQLIDSWLPASTGPVRSTKPAPASRAVQLFARAGWLKGVGLTSTTHKPPIGTGCAGTPHPSRVRLVRTSASSHLDARLVISGRISDVCAELDRLAALEPLAAVRRI